MSVCGGSTRWREWLPSSCACSPPLLSLSPSHTTIYTHTTHRICTCCIPTTLSLSLSVSLSLSLSSLSPLSLSPLSLQYHREFADPFWNSQEQNMITYLAMLMTSWAIVCDINYLNPTELKVSSCLECPHICVPY